jgi:hypothetical protein
METLYDLVWISSEDDVVEAFEVHPIQVTWEGVRPGCFGTSIEAIDHEGQRFIGSRGNYYESEEQAWEAAEDALIESYRNCVATIETLMDEKDRLAALLKKVRKEHIK